jgi:hypothetical protein
VIRDGQFPGRQGAVCVAVLLSVREVLVHPATSCQGGVQVITRQTTGP